MRVTTPIRMTMRDVPWSVKVFDLPLLYNPIKPINCFIIKQLCLLSPPTVRIAVSVCIHKIAQHIRYGTKARSYDQADSDPPPFGRLHLPIFHNNTDSGGLIALH